MISIDCSCFRCVNEVEGKSLGKSASFGALRRSVLNHVIVNYLYIKLQPFLSKINGVRGGCFY